MNQGRSPLAAVAALLAVLVSVLLGACGGPSSTDAADPSPTPAVTAEPAAAVEGTWVTGPLTLAQTTATLRRHGLGRWVADYRRNAPLADGTVLSLTLEAGAWNLYGQVGDEPAEPIDFNAEYEVAGDRVTFHHSDGSTTYRWAVSGDTLTLDYATSTMPAYRGIPDEVFQRALYMTEPFTRQD